MKMHILRGITAAVAMAMATAAVAGDQPNARPLVHAAAVKKPKARKVYDAVVNPDGTLARGSATASVHIGTGRYEVDYSIDVTNCSYVASIGVAGGGTAAVGFITTAARDGTPNGVFVETSSLTASSTTTLADRPFHLHVAC